MKKFISLCFAMLAFVTGIFAAPSVATVAVAILGANAVTVAASEESAIVAKIRKAFPGVDKSQITKSFLRAEVSHSNTASTYTFNFNRQTQTFNPEVLLPQSNVLVATHLEFQLVRVPTTAATGALQRYHYPSSVIGTAYRELFTLYNGFFQINSGNVTTRPISAWDFLAAPRTQDNGTTQFDSLDFGDQGKVKIEAPVIFAGNQQQSIVLNGIDLGGTISYAPAANTATRLAVVAHGWSVFNGAQYISQGDQNLINLNAAIEAGGFTKFVG